MLENKRLRPAFDGKDPPFFIDRRSSSPSHLQDCMLGCWMAVLSGLVALTCQPLLIQ